MPQSARSAAGWTVKVKKLLKNTGVRRAVFYDAFGIKNKRENDS